MPEGTRPPKGWEHGFNAEMTAEEREQVKADDHNATAGDMNKEDGYNCDICKNRGNIAVVTQNEMFGYYTYGLQDCKCCRIRNAIRRLNRSGLKNRVKECTFERYETQDAWQQTIKDKAMRFAASDGDDWFFIGGQSGAGKTHICTAAAIAKLKQGRELRYMEWREEVPKIKACIKDAPKYEEMMRELKTVAVLYIDDLFKVGRRPDGEIPMPTQGDINLAFEIINYRSSQPELITIISTERTMAELIEIDEAVAGRIAARSKQNGYCINLSSDSRKNWRMRGMTEL